MFDAKLCWISMLCSLNRENRHGNRHTTEILKNKGILADWQRVRIPPTPPKSEDPAISTIAGFFLRFNGFTDYSHRITSLKTELFEHER